MADFARRFWQDLLNVLEVGDDAHFIALVATRCSPPEWCPACARNADPPAESIFDHPVFADFVTRTIAALGEDSATVDKRLYTSGPRSGPSAAGARRRQGR
ncbi:hypothetical protein [Streptomyces sp. NPDC059743]|uniref:hypothetical protein n=1 Tax=Streptomyces sp. NPDC059743 TaxID=3346928 RepID=UPI003668279F